MKVLYLDCYGGLTPEIITGALLQVYPCEDLLREELLKSNLGDFQLEINDIFSPHRAKTVKISCADSNNSLSLAHMQHLLSSSSYSPFTIETSLSVLRRLEASYQHTYGLKKDNIRLDKPLELLVTIVAVSILIEKISPVEIISSPLPVNFNLSKVQDNFVSMEPVLMDLLKGMPVTTANHVEQLVTPEGVALLQVITGSFGLLPREITLHTTGYGVSLYESGTSKIMRAILGETNITFAKQENIVLLETNIDDMNPEFYPYVMEKLLSNGALDTYLTPIIMKKGRPGITLSAMTSYSNVDILTKIILEETTSLGVRLIHLTRSVACREIIEVDTVYGKIRVKLARLSQGSPTLRSIPEFEDCKQAAMTHNVPIGEVYKSAISASKY